MMRPVAIVLAFALAIGLLGGSGISDHRDEEWVRYSTACEFYRARSGPTDTQEQQETLEFSAFLAKDCAAAMVSLDTGTPMQSGRAELLLSRIALLRETVEAMNADRAQARRHPVTPTGEFLIAHRMGLLIIFEAWLGTGVEVSLASYP